MNLSQLIAYRNYLEKTGASLVGESANRDLDKITHLVQTNIVQIEQFTEQITAQQKNIQKDFEQFQQLLTQLNQEINTLIAQQEPAWFRESYRLYESEMCYDCLLYTSPSPRDRG